MSPVHPFWSWPLGEMRRFLQGIPQGAFFSQEILPGGFCSALGGSEPVLTVFFSGKAALECRFEEQRTKVLSTQTPS